MLIEVMRKTVSALCLLVASCGDQPLPGGYTVVESAMNREWLKGPDGFIVAPGLIQRLYRDENSILVISLAASSDGEPIPPRPLDRTCFVALLINASTKQTTQITVLQANKLAERMEAVIVRDRSCI